MAALNIDFLVETIRAAIVETIEPASDALSVEESLKL
jgi:hypothetical protein